MAREFSKNVPYMQRIFFYSASSEKMSQFFLFTWTVDRWYFITLAPPTDRTHPCRCRHLEKVLRKKFFALAVLAKKWPYFTRFPKKCGVRTYLKAAVVGILVKPSDMQLFFHPSNPCHLKKDICIILTVFSSFQ